MGDIIEIYWMESTIHPMPHLICDPRTMSVPNITVWESLSFFGLSEVLFLDESSPYWSRVWWNSRRKLDSEKIQRFKIIVSSKVYGVRCWILWCRVMLKRPKIKVSFGGFSMILYNYLSPTSASNPSLYSKIVVKVVGSRKRRNMQIIPKTYFKN